MRFHYASDRTSSVLGIRVAPDLAHISVVGVDDNGGELCLATVVNPLALPLLDYPIIDYTIALFTHSSWPEARVLTVMSSEKRVGLLFSLQALATPQSVLIDKTAWNEYAFIALQKICLGEFVYGPQELLADLSASIPITKLFSDDTIVLVLDQSSCRSWMSDADFTNLADRCLPSLAKFGFYRLDDQLKPGDFRANALSVESNQTTLSLQPYSLAFPVDARAFFDKIMLTSVQREQNPAFRLFLGYQVLEILMGELYEVRLRAFAAQAIIAPNAVALRALNEELNVALNEKGRLGLVFNANRGTMTNDAFVALQDACDALLARIDLTKPQAPAKSKNPETAIYAVRNYAFHSFARVGPFESELEVIAQCLFILLCDLATAYQSPA